MVTTVGIAQRRWLRHRATDLRTESIRTYRDHMASVVRSCGPDLPVDEWGRSECVTWWHDQSHLGPRTLRHRLSAVRLWARWCVLHELMASDPTMHLPTVRAPRSVPRALTARQVEQAWHACPDDRTRMIVSLMVHEGLRRAEVAGLDWADIDLPRRSMTVRGKGGHERTLPLSTTTAELLDGEQRRWGAVVASTARAGAHMTPMHVGALVQVALDGAGVAATPHALRHTAASDALDGGCPIRTVQRFLGHTSVTSTEIYLRRDISDLRQAVDDRPYRLGS